ncbi:MAG: Factor arrest protein 11 [Bogoriella megaspora]|nr:MAG: Factor arrest protein 11 [Bogoriella megaspora]
MQEPPTSDDIDAGLGLEAVDEVDIGPSVGEERSGLEPAIKPGIDTAEQFGLDSDKPVVPPQRVALPTRPALRRDQSIPPPQQPPPPAPIAQDEPGNPTDSLSITQLRRLVNEFPRTEPTPYAFTYKDASSFPDEIEEWFSYNSEELNALSRVQAAFTRDWEGFSYGETEFTKSTKGQQFSFIQKQVDTLLDDEISARASCLDSLTYFLLGCWAETAGYPLPNYSADSFESKDTEKQKSLEDRFLRSQQQLSIIRSNAMLFLQANGAPALYLVLRTLCLQACLYDKAEFENGHIPRMPEFGELWCVLTIFYILLEVAREEEKETSDVQIRSELMTLQPSPLDFFTEFIAGLRWDEPALFPLPKGTKILLLTWKTILVFFGGFSEAEDVRTHFCSTNGEKADDEDRPTITASPLDYHLFRREISSKYPAYNPPPPLFPLEPDNNSILPPVKDEHGNIAPNGTLGGAATGNHGASILHQPVHIATPAPSPPPSPAGPGGKGGKKHNYQTNQMFPFLYPPPDGSTNQLGGKGGSILHDSLVGQKWTGNEIPASILEAAELFAQRMRATRAMKQLWQERVNFMKFERGWTGPLSDESIEPLDLSANKEQKGKGKRSYSSDLSLASDFEDCLEIVEKYYASVLPHLQSFVIVLLKVILHNVTSLLNAATSQGGFQNGAPEGQNPNGVADHDYNGNTNGVYPDVNKSPVGEIDDIRTREIQGKAVSGILILLLKWFKRSHILKFEYLTQLLLDSNYIPLILKLLQSQELERVVNYRCDRDDLNFFHFCRANSHLGLDPSPSPPPEDDDFDDAVPPPIKRHRASDLDSGVAPSNNRTSPPPPPEVDELGYPTSDLPSTPITNFSWRSFFSSINYLRILQKICKGKAHRNLMLVQYKSSQYLRKALKVPQPELRLYTLKLFKNQVPYCGRKWRQSNMRVITAVYLHCRPELRDDWLSGGDVDAEVEESVPLEQALRSLTHWFNLKRYGEKMGADKGLLEEEQDFFARELAKLAVIGNIEGEDGSEEPPEGPWEGGFQMEAW